ncbi:helix-turn-helix domain-containing protein [Paenibacillus sp. YIM B09110]|uniref:helix-turn-helix domain-containing protein n=1 Tax=Paenibacillus sp. YIM B09110 TaxID=3126102 RepID=UPI00301C81C0
MKFELGRCLLQERLADHGMTLEQLAQALQYKRELLTDYMENKRVMPLKNAVAIARTIGCMVDDLYEWTALE